MHFISFKSTVLLKHFHDNDILIGFCTYYKKNCLNSATIYWSAYSKLGKWAIMYWGYQFSLFLGFWYFILELFRQCGHYLVVVLHNIDNKEIFQALYRIDTLIYYFMIIQYDLGLVIIFESTTFLKLLFMFVTSNASTIRYFQSLYRTERHIYSFLMIGIMAIDRKLKKDLLIEFNDITWTSCLINT